MPQPGTWIGSKSFRQGIHSVAARDFACHTLDTLTDALTHLHRVLVRQPHADVDCEPPMLAWYFSLTFAVSWACWVAAAAMQRVASAGPALPVLATVLLYVGPFAPAVVALSMTARSGEPGGGTTLLNRVFQGDVPARW